MIQPRKWGRWRAAGAEGGRRGGWKGLGARAWAGERLVQSRDRAAVAKFRGEGRGSPNRKKPFVILLDLMMPVMSGWDLLAIIGNYVRLAKIPVVIISVHEPTGTGQVGAINRCKRYLKKPFSDENLLSTVSQFAHQDAH